MAVGPNTLLRSEDGGLTWRRRGGGDGADLTSMSCAGTELCLLTTVGGDRLLRSEDGGQTATPLTAATQALRAAAFASPTRAVAAGAGGATVTSDDGGRNYAPVGGDIGGSFPYGLRSGPDAETAYALGGRGQLARTVDGGATWRALAVATSADLRDVSFVSRESATCSTSSAASSRRATPARAGRRLTRERPRRPARCSPSPMTSSCSPRAAIHRAVGSRRFEAVRGGGLRGLGGTLDRFARGGAAIAAFGAVARSSCRRTPGRRGGGFACPRSSVASASRPSGCAISRS